MDTPDSKPVTYSNGGARLPPALAELCAMSNWVVWRWTKNGSGKWTEPPFQSRFPSRLASNNMAATWSSLAAAVEVVRDREADGVGFVLTGTEIVAIDLDHCRDPATAKIDPWAAALLEKAVGSYVEITVSGTGLRVIGKGAGEETHTNYKVG
jgi:primase-polymerase (primpol)-like protein